MVNYKMMKIYQILFSASPVISLRSNMDFISRNIESFKRRLFNQVQVMFKTRQKDGIILTTGNNNAFLTLEMYLGRIRLEANAGAGKWSHFY